MQPRGGGSLEDLWAFNEEAVARAPPPRGRVPVERPDVTSDVLDDVVMTKAAASGGATPAPRRGAAESEPRPA